MLIEVRDSGINFCEEVIVLIEELNVLFLFKGVLMYSQYILIHFKCD